MVAVLITKLTALSALVEKSVGTNIFFRYLYLVKKRKYFYLFSTADIVLLTGYWALLF